MQLSMALKASQSDAEVALNSTANVREYKSQLLKWIGNKQRFAHEIISFFPKKFSVYHEPFLGSAGVLGVLAPNKAQAADCFAPLIGIWQTLKSDPELLKKWYRDRWEETQNGEKIAVYEAIKARYNSNANAADLLFLCRAAYGGVVRFRMKDGYMSTPCGIHTVIHPSVFARRVDEWTKRVSGTNFYIRDYSDSLDNAREGDVVYCDPPYSFSQAILYGAQRFSLEDLVRRIAEAKKRGVFVALSIDGTKKSGNQLCDIEFPKGLFEKEVPVNVGRSMLRRFQMGGETLESEVVKDRLLLTHDTTR